MVTENIRRRIRAAVYPLQAATRTGISNVEKSSHHRSAFILLSTVVEALCHELVKKNTAAPDHYFFDYFEYKQVYKISAASLSTPTDTFICKKVNKKLKVTDTTADFSKLLDFLKKRHIITPQKFKSIDWIRNERNKIHIQGLDLADTGYTKAKTERVAKEISYLISKI